MFPIRFLNILTHNFLRIFIIETLCFTVKYTTHKIHMKPHPGLRWCIFHILTSEDIDGFTEIMFDPSTTVLFVGVWSTHFWIILISLRKSCIIFRNLRIKNVGISQYKINKNNTWLVVDMEYLLYWTLEEIFQIYTFLCILWSQRLSLIFLHMRVRELQSSEHHDESQSGERRTPVFTLDLNLTFMQMPGSGSDPRTRIGLQTCKSVWLVSLIGNTKGTVGISVTAFLVVNFAHLYQEKNLFVKYFSSQFIHVQELLVFNMEFVSDSVFEALLAVINHKDAFAILPTGHGKSII